METSVILFQYSKRHDKNTNISPVLIKKVNPSIKSYKNPPRASPMMPLQKYLNLSTHYDSKEKILEQIDESIKRGSATKELKHRSIGIFSNPKDRFSYTGFD